MKILELGKMFRPATSHVYPPFKKGRYMEEYVYDILQKDQQNISTKWVYLPIFWTNLQNQPGFADRKANYDLLLQRAIQTLPSHTIYFTIVQHDDGPQLTLPASTIIFGACTGTIPLPLIYEDITHRLMNTPRITKDLLASFVGTSTTHPLRKEMVHWLNQPGIDCHTKSVWNVHVPENDALTFIEKTLRSRFCLAPRGYGRSSFRFFEAMQLDTVPVYIWDDIEWLPYQDRVDYSAFSVSISQKDLPHLSNRLRSITDEQYATMQQELQRVRHYFTLEGMTEYIVKYIETH